MNDVVHTHRWTFVLAALVFGLGVVVRPSLAEDWPRWRGPQGDGTWKATKLPERFPKGGPKKLWARPIKAGFSAVIVAGQRVYTMDRPVPTRKGNTPDGTERILCIDADSGSLEWSFEYAAHYGKLDYGKGPRSAPTVHDGLVYTLGAVGHVYCLKAETGETVWNQDMVRDYKARVPEWGFAAAPLIAGDLVVIHTGAVPNGSLITLDRKTGKEVWRSLPDPAGYCTPILIQSKSGPQLVQWTPENVHGLDPKTGKVFWTVPYKVTYGVSIATPIFFDDIVFVSGYWEGSKAIALGARSTDHELLWTENKFLRGLMAPPLFRNGHVYTLDKKFGLTCCELKTGKKLWDAQNKFVRSGGSNPQATFVWVDEMDRVVALTDEGELILARFSPLGYQELSRAKIIDPTPECPIWANPAFAHGRVYARSDSQLVCVQLVDP